MFCALKGATRTPRRGPVLRFVSPAAKYSEQWRRRRGGLQIEAVVIRRPIQRLCRRLTAEPSIQHQPGFIAWRLLELVRNYKQWYESSAEGERLRCKQPFDEWLREVNASFRRIIQPDIFPEVYLGLVLSEDEINALTQACLERLEWDPEEAISALGYTLKLEVVPALLAVSRSSARTAGPPNAQHAQGAVQAVETILQYGPLDPRHLGPEDQELLHQVFETLRYVAEDGADTGLNPRGMAAKVLANLTDHFERAF